ncbi:nucleotidyltransferase domain-containing protein [Candidatus Woesearchaeota archaeon]|nr:nucleotidyltransferase domain-containing protein [Candidatus Woesearchaeota archaeon]
MQEKKLSRNEIRKWVAREGIIDVVIFGSTVRGKTSPNDIDVCLIIPVTVEKKAIDIAASFRKEFGEFHVSVMTDNDFVKGRHTLVKTLLTEGASVMNGESVSKLFGFNNETLFTYALAGFRPADRVRFHYLLRGRRGAKGILKETKAQILGDGVLIVPTEKEDVIREVFEKWKVKFKSRKMLVG